MRYSSSRMEDDMQASRLRARNRRPGALAALILLMLPFVVSGNTGPKFYPDDPISVEPETQDASRIQPWKIELFYDLLLNQFAKPGDPERPRAGNINTIDEVPDSNWFTNRI